MFLPFASESAPDAKGSLCGLPMAVLQDYLMDSFGGEAADQFDGLCDDLYEPPSEPSEGAYPEVNLFEVDPLEQHYGVPAAAQSFGAESARSTTKKKKPSSSSVEGGAKRRKTVAQAPPAPPREPAPQGAGEDPQQPRSKTQAQIDRRRDRNRILARRTRLRKKFFFESLQQQVAALERENAALKDILRAHPELRDVASDFDVDAGGDEAAANETDRGGGASSASSVAPGPSLTKNDVTLMRLVQGAQRSFCITDPSLDDNPIVYASGGFLEQTGYRLEQVVGRNCRFLQGPLTDRATATKVRDHVERGQDVGVTILNYRSDGTTFWNQLFVAALRDINEKIVNFVGVQIPVPGPDPSALAPDSLKHPAEPGPGAKVDVAGAARNSVLVKPPNDHHDAPPPGDAPSVVVAPEEDQRRGDDHHLDATATPALVLAQDDALSPQPETTDEAHIHVLNRLIQLPQRIVHGTDLATVGAVSASPPPNRPFDGLE